MAEEAPKEAPPAAAAVEEKPDAGAAPQAAAGSLSPRPAHRRRQKQFFRGRRMRMGSLLSVVLLTVVVALGIITLVAWLIYRPHKPRVYVDRAWIYQLNVTDGSVTSNMQFTVLFQNPNRRWTVRYDRLVAFVTYRGQLLTMATPLPILYQGHKNISPVYTYLAGNFVPVYPEVAGSLIADESYGLVELRLVIRGRYRWKTSMWKSTRYHLHVTCNLLVGLKNRNNGQVALFEGQRCDVDI